MKNKVGPFDLGETPIHIPFGKNRQPFVPLPWFDFSGESFERYVQELGTEEEPGRIIMIETMITNWPSWERHTEGDELVIILEGSGIFIQEIDEELHRHPFKSGDTFLNPAGVWHTADVHETMRAIYITPCFGTEHKTRE